jgi:hypothetical protein
MFRRLITSSLLCLLFFRAVLADPITYQQIRQGTGATLAQAPVPTLADGIDTKKQAPAQTPAQGANNQGPRVQPSPNHPEYVRLPDGRIIKYGPGVICDEKCVEAVPLARARAPRSWYVLPPVLAAGILCAFLCRGGADATPPGIVPPLVIQPSPSPTIPQPTPTPPAEIPEPSTLVLLGLGLGTLLARRKLAHKTAE